jgi:hypothetical protein
LKILSFSDPAADQTRSVGRVHSDGSIYFRGRRYRTIKDVPKECVAFRADVSSTVQWRALYRAVDPTHKVTRPR